MRDEGGGGEADVDLLKEEAAPEREDGKGEPAKGHCV